MDFYVYKALVRGIAPVARISLGETRTLVVSTTEVAAKALLGNILRREARVGEWTDDGILQKRRANSLEEAVTARLKRFLHRPYFASKTVPENFNPTHEIRVEVSR